ncbi:30S ribosomal protein S19 [Patescibacteria group bacterium]|nr:30S ribosomal protein S19 [Patescibacteria group bacterium]
MSRSLKKGPYVNPRILKKISKLKVDDKTVVNIWDRSCTITPEMVGFTFGVHNGRVHTPVKVVENMVGHKFGEFSPTRKFVTHGGRMAKDLATEKAKKETETAKKATVELETKK